MNTADMAEAVAVSCDWEEQRRANEVDYLEATMVLTVSECGHFHNPIVGISCFLMFLCEYGVRHVDVFGLAAAVGNDKSSFVDTRQKILKVLKE